ncbi:hypothetical protein [Leuconostoc pseudomesenteroides]|uniref:hypothetical protein n=1 Tax=Leuconostoc pseudomesenteroides TaxID=33968 RepID=UPI0039EB0FE5
MSKYNNRHGALRKGNGVLYAIIFLLSGLLIVSFFIITGKTSNNHTLSKSSVIKTDKKDSLSSSDKSSSASTSSSIESQSESDSENSTSSQSSSDTYVNAYGHTVVNGQEDNTGEAEHDRELNVDVENIKWLANSDLTTDQKFKQIRAWDMNLTVGIPSNIQTIWARDKKTALATITPDGTIKINE